MNTVRTVAATKASFLSSYRRPIGSIFRRFIEEFLVELHLDTVSSRFTYDPFFALGLITVFDTFMSGYQPAEEVSKIFAAVCQALQMKPDVIRQDGTKLLELVRSGDRADRLKLLQLQPEAADVGGIRGILTRIQSQTDFRYSRTFLLGLYTAFDEVAPADSDEAARTELFNTLAQTLNLSDERVEKDLKLYRNNLERLAQAQAVARDMAEAAERQKERATSTPAAVAGAPSGAATAEAPTPESTPSES